MILVTSFREAKAIFEKILSDIELNSNTASIRKIMSKLELCSNHFYNNFL